MKLLLTGGSANGKSTYGRQLARQLPAPRYLIYTAQPYEEESTVEQRRRQMLSDDGFTVVFCSRDLGTLDLPQGATVLLDCLCNLTANEMFDVHGMRQGAREAVLCGMAALEARCDNLLVITNEIGSGCRQYFDETPRYIETLGAINAALADRFDSVCEVVCGIACVRKGTLPESAVRKGDCPMTLVVGGVASGKRSYAQSLGYSPAEMSASPEDDKPVLYDLQEFAAGIQEITPELLEALCRKQVILCNEVGSGVIPLDRRERDARVLTGALCVHLAQRAERVVRLVCGIPTVLKG